MLNAEWGESLIVNCHLAIVEGYRTFWRGDELEEEAGIGHHSGRHYNGFENSPDNEADIIRGGSVPFFNPL